MIFCVIPEYVGPEDEPYQRQQQLNPGFGSYVWIFEDTTTRNAKIKIQQKMMVLRDEFSLRENDILNVYVMEPKAAMLVQYRLVVEEIAP